MGKVLLYASLVVTLGATAIGFLNKSKLADVAKQGADVQEEVKKGKAELEQTQKSLEETKKSVTKVTEEKDQIAGQVDGLKSDVEKAKSKANELTTQVGAKEAEITKLAADVQAKDTEIATLKSTQTAAPVVQGPSPEVQAMIQEKEALVTKLQGDVAAARSQIEDLQKKNNDRMAQKMRNGLEGRILAVNQAWNFVVLNLGDRNGVVGNVEMLIKRGSQLVGKVRVTSVEPSTSIADIVANSIPSGLTIQPGDHVIYQTTVE